MKKVIKTISIFISITLILALAPSYGGNAGATEENFFVWPLSETENNIGSAFGFRRTVGRMHLGVDVMVPVGVEVNASASGTVRVATRERAWGNYIVIDHDAPFQGLSTVYAHLDRIGDGIRPGVHVERGQIIGTSGRTGNVTAPHLHFELHHNNIMVNPLPMFHKDESRATINPNPLFISSGGKWVYNPNFDPTFSENEYRRLAQGSNPFLLPTEEGEEGIVETGPTQPSEGEELPIVQPPIPDVSAALGASAWAVAEIDEALSLGLIPEDLLSDFRENITRAEFCKTIVQSLIIIAGMDEEPDEVVEGLYLDDELTPFDDTEDMYVSIAFSWGIVNGIGDRAFAPQNTITRQEAAAMLSRAADLFEITGFDEMPAEFADAGSFAPWASRPITFVSASGIMGGVGNNLFAPLSGYTREQTFVTMMRLAEVVFIAEYEYEYY